MAKKKGMTPKQRLWLAAYLDRGSSTFMHATNAARAAGYSGKNDANLSEIGYRNKKALQSRIDTWLEEEGLSDSVLKQKLVQLLDAKETKMFAEKGEVKDMIEVEALEVQRKTLDMALKVKGLYSPEKHEHELHVIEDAIQGVCGNSRSCIDD
ncbi:hypothetical protein [Halodesulfovibrio sp.]|jgi:phage terminase small subunit|uniref:hypothetical protein n=1 Tax=Halodesulfovibrio sp. TaxID=1912772 RepID=UPI0025F5F1BD|nr:hypothetical protein [Halodesulfovibrio sp.]MCT4627948.1 terminase small subunit [Halodesulfovibrio sp.]